jgi:hypothetical protein
MRQGRQMQIQMHTLGTTIKDSKADMMSLPQRAASSKMCWVHRVRNDEQ